MNFLKKSYFFKVFKRLLMNESKTIGTHDGNFHADEVLACAMLTKYTSLYKAGEIIRTRNLSILEKLDIVVDVGGVYDPSKNRFDHHQKEFQDGFDCNHTIRLSSAGLIYKHFGKEVIKNLITERIMNELSNYEIKLDLTNDFISIIYHKLYDSFIQTIDANDNGVGQYPKELFAGKNIEPNFTINSSLDARISRLNPTWTEKNPNERTRFYEAMKLADEELVGQIKFLITSWWPSRPIVEDAIEKRFEVSKTGEIIKLSRSCPWKDHLIEIEKEKGLEGKLKFVLFPENASGDNWRVQGINFKGSFALRLALKENWRGINDLNNLRKISGIEEIIFCHASGFIGGAKSLESAIKMAEVSLLG